MASADRSVLLAQLDRLYRDGTATVHSDAQLLERYLGLRDEAAFEAIVERHGPLVLSLCRRFLRDPCDIEDAFQATFLILARKGGSIRKRQVLSSWLYGVAFRVATRSRSELIRRRSVEAGTSRLDDACDLSSREPDELGPVLDEELNRLPEKYRVPIVLCYFKAQTHDQAAAELRWPVGTVRSRLSRGRELLRDRLTRRGCVPSASLLGLAPGASLRAILPQVPQHMVLATVSAAGRFLGVATTTGTLPAMSLSLSSPLSGSATTLAQGVLTTMVFSQIKLVGAGLMAAGVVVGSVGAGAWALSPQEATRKPDKPPAPGAETQVKAVDVKPSAPIAIPEDVPSRAQPTLLFRSEAKVESRLAELERKLDLLIERMVHPERDPMLAASPLPTTGPVVGTRPLPTPSLSSSAIESSPLPLSTSDELPAATTVRVPAAEIASDLRPSDPGVPRATRGVRPTPTGEDVAGSVSRRSTPPRRAEPSSELDLPPDSDPFDGSVLQRRDSRPRARVRLEGETSASPREIEAQIKIARKQFERNDALFRSGALSRKEFDAPVEQIQVLVGRLRDMEEMNTEEMELLQLELKKRQAGIERAKTQEKICRMTVARHSQSKAAESGIINEADLLKAETQFRAATAQVAIEEQGLHEVELRVRHFQRRQEVIREVLKNASEGLPAEGAVVPALPPHES